MCQCQSPTDIRFTFNLSAATIRQHDGRDHYVMPMVMLTEGVHLGSNGPLLYSANELKQTASAWNGKPITVNHPHDRQAFDPVKHLGQHVGTVFNARFDSKQKRLTAEAWIDVQRALEVDRRIHDAVTSREQMEVSTGLFTDNEMTEGQWNGQFYIGLARNHRPDHLALLPDKIGACSIAKGCGLLRNEGDWPPPTAPWITKEEWQHQHMAPLTLPVMNFAEGAGRAQTKDTTSKPVGQLVLPSWD